MSTQDIMNIRPGYLNDFDVDDIDQESIDYQSESPESIMGRMRDKIFAPNKFKTSGTLIGILLRSDNKYSGECTQTDLAIGIAKPGTQKYGLNTYKIRIPELHFMLPVPKNLGQKASKSDKLAIDSYPDIKAIDTYVQTQGAVPGDLVKVELANKGALSRMFFAGPLDPKITGTTVEDLKECVDACRKKYTGSGSPGDCIGKNVNLAKLDDVSPIANGAGNTEKKIIEATAPNAPSKWLVNNIGTDHVDGVRQPIEQFAGKTWIGVMNGNGKADTEAMLEKHVGRNTLIFMPVGVAPEQNIELIYFFHDNLKFSRDANEWKKMGSIMTAMVSKKQKFDGGRRNIVFVIPEMPWSKEDVTELATGWPRVQSQKAHRPAEARYQYKDRHMKIWDGEDSDLEALHSEVLNILSTKFEIETVSHISLVADGFGTAAILNAATKGKLKTGAFKKYLYKIQILHGGYSATGAKNFLDNDFIKIAENIDATQVQIEVHISSKGFTYEKDDNSGKNRLARDSAISFLGNISKSFNAWSTSDDNKHPELVGPAADPNNAIKQMVEDNSKLIAGMNATSIKYVTNQIYNAGKAFYSSNKDKTLIMANAFSFVIFRGVSSAKSIEWMSWIPEGDNVPTAVSTSAVSSTGGNVNVIVPPSEDGYTNTKITDTHKKTFEKFNGKTLLFNSPNSALDGITSIVVPQGSDLTRKFELIYFLHGYGGSDNSQGWNKNLLKQVEAMPKAGTEKVARNVVYVTTQLNVAKGADNDKKATFRSGSGKSFVAFHKDVIHYLGKKGLNATASPAFINFKVYGEGYYSLDGIITQLTSPSIEGVPVQRIDYLDASYKFRPVRDKVYKNPAFGATPGTNFEILVFCTDEETYDKVRAHHNTEVGPKKYNGDKKITEGKEIKYSQLKGLYINKNTDATHSNVYFKHFDQKSLLPDGKGDATTNFEPVKKSASGGTKINIKNVPVSYDKDGNAINSDGETLPDKYDLPLKDLKCTKDQIKNHKAKTTVPQAQKDCEKACRDVASGKEPEKPPFDPKDAHKIENPFKPAGLIVHAEPNFKSSDKKRSTGSITTIVLHEGALSRAGTARTLNKKHLGTHFTIGSFGTYQHIDIDRTTGHAGKGRNGRSIGIDLVFNHTTTISKSFAQFAKLRDKPAEEGKISGAEQLRKKKGLTSTQQIIKTRWDSGNMSIIPNQSLLEQTYKLVKALVANSNGSIKPEFPAVQNGKIRFGYGGQGHSGIVAHRLISRERSDGQWAQLYIYLRMKKGLTQKPAYKKLLDIAWKAAGWSTAKQGDTTSGYPKEIKSNAKRNFSVA